MANAASAYVPVSPSETAIWKLSAPSFFRYGSSVGTVMNFLLSAPDVVADPRGGDVDATELRDGDLTLADGSTCGRCLFGGVFKRSTLRSDDQQ
jgi:hypothetical protein